MNLCWSWIQHIFIGTKYHLSHPSYRIMMIFGWWGRMSISQRNLIVNYHKIDLTGFRPNAMHQSMLIISPLNDWMNDQHSYSSPIRKIWQYLCVYILIDEWECQTCRMANLEWIIHLFCNYSIIINHNILEMICWHYPGINASYYAFKSHIVPLYLKYNPGQIIYIIPFLTYSDWLRVVF